MIKLSIKAKIWATIGLIVVIFTGFLLIFFPKQEEKYFLKNYNKEVAKAAETVAYFFGIAANQQDLLGMEKALDFIKGDTRVKFLAVIQKESSGRDTVFKVRPVDSKITSSMISNDTVLIRTSPFKSELMNGRIMVGFTKDEITNYMKEIRLVALSVSFFILLIGIGLGYFLAVRISKPIHALSEAALKVGNGDLTQKVHNTSKDEIGLLTRSFNDMVSGLASAEEKLNLKNKELSQTLEDLKSAQSKLVQSEKMASLGQLTAGIAHEINNPINFVSGNIKPLKRDIEDVLKILGEYEKAMEASGNEPLKIEFNLLRNELDLDYTIDEIKKLLIGIEDGASRTTEIVLGLKNFSRLDENSKKHADINQCLDSTLNLLHSQLGKEIKIVKEYGNIPDLLCLPGQLNQVFLNIINNAIQALGGKGEVKIITRETVENSIEIIIKDNGKGMSEETKQKIFDPFFTTKEVGEGTGLGLSISYGIIQDHEGSIKVESTLGEGSSFIITLPFLS